MPELTPVAPVPLDTTISRLVLVDSNDYTASILIDDLRRRGLGYIHWVASTLELPRVLESVKPDIVVVNYHSDQPDNLMVCSTIKLIAPLAATVVITSPGPALKAVRHWAQQSSSIDVIIEKPLSDEQFFITVTELLRVRTATREANARVARLANLVPDGALSVMDEGFNDEAEIFETVVLFTDIRGSSQLIRETPPQMFFQNLNGLLSAQAALVRNHQGAVVKYTGDGMMAVFRGMGRSYLALRCGLELAALDGTHPVSVWYRHCPGAGTGRIHW
jgi:AmiR/NasT family two-component response regulator